MFNPIDTIKKYRSRLGKPIRPIVEVQKSGSIINIVTTTVETENMVQDTYQNAAWEVHPSATTSAIYVDGVYKGNGYFAGEEGHILDIRKDVELFNEVFDDKGNVVIENGKPKVVQVLSLAYKGLNSKLLDASLIERGSALKMSWTQTLIYCLLVGLMAFMAGMSYAN